MKLVFTLLFTAFLAPKEGVFTGCTADKQAVQLNLDLTDNITRDVEGRLQKAFSDTAAKYRFEDLVSREGFVAFSAAVSEADKAYVAHVEGPPSSTGSCK